MQIKIKSSVSCVGNFQGLSSLKMKMPTLQTYDDYLEDVLSLDMAQEAVADRSLNSNMFDFLVKEEPLREDDLRALQKDRQKKDNHNMSKLIMKLSIHFIKDIYDILLILSLNQLRLKLDRKYLLTLLIFVDFS